MLLSDGTETRTGMVHISYSEVGNNYIERNVSLIFCSNYG